MMMIQNCFNFGWKLFLQTFKYYVFHFQVGLHVEVRLGRKEERRQEAINVEENGGREGRQDKTKGETERGCGRAEEEEEEEGWWEVNILTLMLILIKSSMMGDPQTWVILILEVDLTTKEGDTGWLQGDTDLELKCLLHWCLFCSYLFSNVMFPPLRWWQPPSAPGT